MIKFHIPGFAEFADANLRLLQMMKQEPDLFYPNVEVDSAYGIAGPSIWAGGRICAGTPLCTAEDLQGMISAYNSEGVAVRYTFTNSLLEESDLSDRYSNKCMRLANNGKNDVLVCSDVLEDYLRKQYPEYRYIASTTKCVRDIDKINDMTEKYDLVVLDWRDNHDASLLEGIKNKSKIELLVNECCGPNCPRREEHYKAVSKDNLGFSTKNHAKFQSGNNGEPGCPYQYPGLANTLRSNPATITAQDIYTVYAPMGFENFKIEGRGLGLKWAILSYMYYLVKPEHWIRFLEVMLPIQ